MKRTSKLALASLLFASASYAQTPPVLTGQYPDSIQKTSMGNLSSATGDSFISIYNSGSSAVAGSYGPKTTSGWITAEIYVFDASDEQLVSCCYCPLSPDAAATISAKNSLISNPLTGKPPGSVTVTLVTAAGNTNIGQAPGPEYPLGTTAGARFGTGLRGTRTTTHLAANYPGVAPFVTEAPLNVTNISAGEYANIVNLCYTFIWNGSGSGVCGGCNAGASNAVAPRATH
jgi:hypothetical protein